MTDNTLLEVMARAMARTYFCNSFYRNPNGSMTTDVAALSMLNRKVNEGWKVYQEHAQAVLTALEAEGYVVAKKEPTDAMLNGARDWSAKKYGKPIGNDAAQGCWTAMLSAREPVAKKDSNQ